MLDSFLTRVPMTKQNAVDSRRSEIPNIKLIPAVAHLRTTVSERRNIAARQMLVHRIRAEFEEMPGLSVTLKQASKLFGLAPDAASRILRGLIEDEVLHMRDDRCYVLRAQC
jgi:hypothetical protein